MPELPEVETTRRGIEPLVAGRTVAEVVVREARLRWPVPDDLSAVLAGQVIHRVERRAKYLLLRCAAGTLIIHLGMSGYLRWVSAGQPASRHDHIDILFTDGSCLRYNDSRRFGSFLWGTGDPRAHPLLVGLGPEPLSDEMSGEYLYRRSRNRKLAVKSFIMDQQMVVGVGNIYANEALFQAGIAPGRQAGLISLQRYRRLADAIGEVLDRAIAAGGSTLRDFHGADGRPGYFPLQFQVYGRAGEGCPGCGREIEQFRLAQRSTYCCRHCQR